MRRFSAKAIKKSRFIRASIESEVLRRAAAECSAQGVKLIDDSLEVQHSIVANEDFDAFTEQDYVFHKNLCKIAGVEFAFEVISDEKAKIDRLCVLSHSDGGDRLSELVSDHDEIGKQIKAGNGQKAVDAGMLHLSRLDGTIEKILNDHPEYFES